MTVVDGPITADGYDWRQVIAADGTIGYVVGEDLGLPVAPALEVGAAALDNTDALYLRDDATVAGSVLATLATGDTMTVVDGPVVADGYTWFQLEAAVGTAGWVVGEFLAFA